MDPGAEVDIVSLRPVDRNTQVKNRQIKAMEQTALRAVKAGISETAMGQEVLTMVRDGLIARLLKMATDDPECQAYMTILDKIGSKECMARKAAKELFEFYHLELPVTEGAPK